MKQVNLCILLDALGLPMQCCRPGLRPAIPNIKVECKALSSAAALEINISYSSCSRAVYRLL